MSAHGCLSRLSLSVLFVISSLQAGAGDVAATPRSDRPAERVAAAAEIAAANPADNKHSIAVLVGNKTYAGLPSVPFGRRDADAMRRFVSKELGYRDGNIIDLRDATKAKLEKVVGSEASPRGKLYEWASRGSSDVLVFFSGHGVSGPSDKMGYLLPVDGDPELVESTGYSIALLFDNLSRLNAGSVTVILEAGFAAKSHGGRLVQANADASVAIDVPDAAGHLVVLTATQGNQTAGWDVEARHGLFTVHVLNALNGHADGPHYGNGDGAVTLGEVKHYLDDEMTDQARRRHGRIQRATVHGDQDTVLALYDRRRLPAPEMTIGELEARHREMRDAAPPAGDAAELSAETVPEPTDQVAEATAAEATVGDSESRPDPLMEEFQAAPETPPTAPVTELEIATTNVTPTPDGSAEPETSEPQIETSVPMADLPVESDPAPAAEAEPVATVAVEPEVEVAPQNKEPSGRESAAEIVEFADELDPLISAFAPAKTRDEQIAVGVFAQQPGEVIKDCDACPEMIVIAEGKFAMGSPELEAERWPSEGPQRDVSISAFALGKFEVTFADYAACVHDKSCRPSGGKATEGGADRPVVRVGWADAQAYAGWLSTKTGTTYRLPSEAEWEYAARAGTTTPFSFGGTITPNQANYNGNYSYRGGPSGRYLGTNAPVGSYPGNDFGLHDLHGNVWEWVEDCWHDDYTGAPADGRPWIDAETCGRRVLRGGSGASKPGDLRAARRVGNVPGDRALNDVGFRVARSLDQ